MGLEDIGVRAVIDNLGGYISGMASMQKATDAQSKSLETMGSVSVKARADLDRIMYGTKEVTSSLGNLTGVQEMANRGFAGMQGPVRSSTDALEAMGSGLSDDTRELVGMTGAMNSTTTSWEKFKNSMDSVMESVRQHKVAFAAFGATIVGSLGLMVREAEAQRLSQVKLSLALENVGVSYAGVRKELEANMAATARKTGISDEAQREALSKLVFITGSYEKSLAALPTVLDLAAFAGMDAASAAMILGRAMSGSTAMLTRYGIYVKEGASATEILDAVMRKVNGAAEAMRSPFSVAKDQMGELGETIGAVLLPPLGMFLSIVVGAVNILREFVDHTGILGKALIWLTGIVGLGTLAMVAWTVVQKNVIFLAIQAALRTIAHTIAQIALNVAYAAGIAPATGFAVAVNLGIWPLTLIVGIIAAVVAGIVLLIKNWDKVMSMFGLGKKTTLETADSIDNLNAEISNSTERLADQKTALEKEQAELKRLQDEYAYTKNNAAGYRDEITRLNAAIAAHEARIASLNALIDKTKTKMADLEKATADAYAELNKLSAPRLEGMQAYEDQLFAIEIELKKLELQQIQQGESPEITARIAQLEKQRRELELTRDIKFDPLTRDAKESVETLTGLNDELAPSSVMARIAELGKQITANNAEAIFLGKTLSGYTLTLGSLTSSLNGLQGELAGIMSTVNDSLSVLDERIFTLTNTIYLLGVEMAKTQAIIDSANTVLTTAEQPTITKKKTGINWKELLADLVPFGPVIANFGKDTFGAAYGGYFPQTQPVMVGERGPEVVMMPAGATVQPNTYNTNYNVNANYSKTQAPVTLAMDLESIRMRSR